MVKKVLLFLHKVVLYLLSWAICAGIAWCICRIFGWRFLPWVFTPVWALLCFVEEWREQRKVSPPRKEGRWRG